MFIVKVSYTSFNVFSQLNQNVSSLVHKGHRIFVLTISLNITSFKIYLNVANYYSDSSTCLSCCVTMLRMTLNGQDLVTKVILSDWPIDLLKSLAMMTSPENLYDAIMTGPNAMTSQML